MHFQGWLSVSRGGGRGWGCWGCGLGSLFHPAPPTGWRAVPFTTGILSLAPPPSPRMAGSVGAWGNEMTGPPVCYSLPSTLVSDSARISRECPEITVYTDILCGSILFRPRQARRRGIQNGKWRCRGGCQRAAPTPPVWPMDLSLSPGPAAPSLGTLDPRFAYWTGALLPSPLPPS